MPCALYPYHVQYSTVLRPYCTVLYCRNAASALPLPPSTLLPPSSCYAQPWTNCGPRASACASGRLEVGRWTLVVGGRRWTLDVGRWKSCRPLVHLLPPLPQANLSPSMRDGSSPAKWRLLNLVVVCGGSWSLLPYTSPSSTLPCGPLMILPVCSAFFSVRGCVRGRVGKRDEENLASVRSVLPSMAARNSSPT